MTTATIRRNADGQQNLADLRKALAATRSSVYKQGGNWMTSAWSEARGCYMTETCPYYWTERQAIQSVLGEIESKDEAKYHAEVRKQIKCRDKYSGEEFFIDGDDPQAEIEQYIAEGLDQDSGSIGYDVDTEDGRNFCGEVG